MTAKSYGTIKKRILGSLLLFLFVFVTEASAIAGTVRGKLVRSNGYAAAYVAVSLYNQAKGRSSFAYSGTDGLYYLYNVPPGDYHLEIWVSKTKSMVYTIRVSDSYYTDIAPIPLP